MNTFGIETKMVSPLENLPLNTKKSYVMAKTYDGCEVYIPVNSTDYDVLVAKRDELKTYFVSIAPEPDEPMLA